MLCSRRHGLSFFLDVELQVRYPKIIFNDCCGTPSDKSTFLSACSAGTAQGTCIDVEEGSAIVTYSFDSANAKQNFANVVAGDNVGFITVGGVDHDATFAHVFRNSFLIF